ncbi:dephospho-CoA kinase [Carboxydochorda subterranea]|uniref:Dephospho-CoA kinase n=1 Tax=Carboxydichorda subterranea TaxID=3109565 RepID=A0ABZ1BUB4_9FIRM|nr:dephospho-CoA kinase [Limnochorda sp. L945t]WRP16251.1 dephospho-CoA kinase [Limnochorda sp. L945t]
MAGLALGAGWTPPGPSGRGGPPARRRHPCPWAAVGPAARRWCCRHVPVVGLTGGFASGKSVVREMLRALGAGVVDADTVTRELSRPGGPVWRAIVEALGAGGVLRPDAELDRAAIRRRIFEDAGARLKVDAVTHPIILAELRRRVAGLMRSDQKEHRARPVVVEVPLLFEAGRRACRMVDVTVVVWADPETCLQRATGRGLDPGEAQRAIEAQWPLERKRRLADWVVDNSGRLEKTRRQVRRLWRVLASSCASHWWLMTSKSPRWWSSSGAFARSSSAAAWLPPVPPGGWWRRRRGST